jgi:sugar-specific transcriptional regulator TrmB
MTHYSVHGFAGVRSLLGRIGLEENEIDVYLAVLSLKVARASTIAKAAKQARSNTYLLLRSLEEKGLVSEAERGKVIHFIAEPPSRIKQYVEERERELRSLAPLIDGVMPLLSSLEKPLTGKPRVTMLQGKDGMKQLYRDALSQEILGIFNPEAMYEAFGENIVTQVLGKKPNMRGRDLLVSSESARRYLREVPDDDDYQVRMLPKNTTFQTDTMIVGDIVALIAYDEEQTIIRIENQNIANAFRAWFELLWTSSRGA